MTVVTRGGVERQRRLTQVPNHFPMTEEQRLQKTVSSTAKGEREREREKEGETEKC